MARQLAAALHNSARVLMQDVFRMLGVVPEHPQLLDVVNNHDQDVPLHDDPLRWDGIALFPGLGGAPKHKPGFERRRKKKRDMRRLYPFLKSWHMLVPCDSCGGFKKKFHLCTTCYDQTRYETQQVREKLKEAGMDLSEETVLKYTDDKNANSSDKRIFNVDRNRPSGWFSQNLWGK